MQDYLSSAKDQASIYIEGLNLNSTHESCRDEQVIDLEPRSIEP